MNDVIDPAEERELRDLLTRTLRDADPPTGLAGAAPLGRRLRRRRRVAASGTAMGAAAVVAVAVGLATGGPGGSRAVDPAPPAGSPSATPSAPTADPAPVRPPSIPVGHWRQLPPEWKAYFGGPAAPWATQPAAELRDTLAYLLPDGVRIVSARLRVPDAAPGEPRGRRGGVTVVIADEDGARGSLEVTLNAETSPPPEPGAITVRDADGTEVTYAGEEWFGEPGAQDGVDRLGAVTVITATALVPDGWVYVSTANTLDDKWGPASPASAPAPLLTQEQVEAFAASDSWTS